MYIKNNYISSTQLNEAISIPDSHPMLTQNMNIQPAGNTQLIQLIQLTQLTQLAIHPS